MRRLKRCIIKNWFWIVTACVLQKFALDYAYSIRGCIAIGGEWLVIPAVMVVATITRNIRRDILAIAYLKEDEAGERCKERRRN